MVEAVEQTSEEILDEEEEEGRKVKAGFTGKYLSLLLKIRNKPMKVRIPSGLEALSIDNVTDVPKISDPNIDEVEMSAVTDPYSYVRIKYDNKDGDYLYEVIEPSLAVDEQNLLEILKSALVMTLNLVEKKTLEEKEKLLASAMDLLLKDFGVTLHPLSRERILYYLKRDFIGFGVIDVMMIDPNVEDASCDGVNIPLYIFHRKYGSIRSNIIFEKEEELDSFVVWLAQKSGKHISVADPLLDATTPDGSRLNATLGKHVTKRGSSFTIRRFKENPFTPVDLLKFKTMSTDMMAYLWTATEYGSSMLVCGGTASGKTTTLNAVLLFIPPQMKIVSIEDTRELNLPHENWIPGLTREGFGGKASGSGGGSIDMFDLLTASMRQRPQYLMVGEVRGKEAYVVFQAMATGKTAYSTFHAEDVQAMVHRMENDPINLPRALMTALDIVLLQAQVKVGTKMTRRVKSLTEIVGMDPETSELITNSVYSWNPADDTFNFSGHSYVYEKVRTIRNWSPREMEREIKRRVDILDYMKLTGVDNYRQVAKIVSAYYRDPKRIMEEVTNTLEDIEDRQA
ncbi:MAG: type II/IV secretion system ATPase subunit [Methanomassiliicoccales archaeon]|nr:type II/IV secretion system ATPase subunit [Methanomassiliicoccales archaeon]NYT15223.1 type II/IV secretion system ATPase subunit [Methanomassiliicoccales archaeon]